MITHVIAPTALAVRPLAPHDLDTATPIKHVIVIYGENRSFDHLFATYRAPSGDHVQSMLSEGIVNDDGTRGPNFAKAVQYQAKDATTFSISPAKSGPYTTLPPPNTSSAPEAASNESPPPFTTIAAAEAVDRGVLSRDIHLLTTGATGLPNDHIDTRINDVLHLAPGPFQLTPGVPYDAYAASPVHRYYQNYQQSDCSAAHATAENPSGCLHDVYPWVEVTEIENPNAQVGTSNWYTQDG